MDIYNTVSLFLSLVFTLSISSIVNVFHLERAFHQSLLGKYNVGPLVPEEIKRTIWYIQKQ